MSVELINRSGITNNMFFSSVIKTQNNDKIYQFYTISTIIFHGKCFFFVIIHWGVSPC